MRERRALIAFLLGSLALLASAPALARDFDGSGPGDSSGFRIRDRDRDSTDDGIYSLSVAGSVASPSSSAFFGENPAGLIYTHSGRVQGFLASGADHPGLLSNGLSFFAGNGLAAATLGVQTYNNATDAGGSITTFNFGAATYAESLNIAFGLNGSYRFQREGQAIDPSLEPTWTADFGFLYNPYGNYRLGFNLYGLSQGVTAGAVGLAVNVNRDSIFAIDASTDNHGKGLTVKPGLGVRAGQLNLTYAYGMQVDKTGTSGITVGNTLGIGYEFSPQFKLMGYYNAFATYFLGATIGLF